MTHSLMYMMCFMIFCGLMSYVLNYFHLLNSLLSLELMSVIIFFFLSSVSYAGGLEMYYLLYFMVMLVCEGVLGLSLLIVSSFNYSGDYMKSFSSVMW